MSYQVLARKWRPHDFESMVGQEHVVAALKHALDENRLHHAYLFTGTRGVGQNDAFAYFGQVPQLCRRRWQGGRDVPSLRKMRGVPSHRRGAIRRLH